ncbi:synaptotagmin-1 [Phlebotomus argentipes]|uniref:synaptotagmin-1 n=1 Tax=Phlebotomus argentipes TaxID=94469 RepID=UPI002892F801|nr:synaptotagmin-1 [Phlebotomus argentipes]
MDLLRTEDVSLSQMALYGFVSFVIVSLLCVLIYVTCSKSYRLNWFENNLLETVSEHGDIAQSQEALISCSTSCLEAGAESGRQGDGDPTFWVPIARAGRSDAPNSSAASDDSQLPTPTSPAESNRSVASSTVPIARNDKHVVLATSPARLKVSSMQAKLDHTKIDTSLYDTVASPTPSVSSTENTHGVVHLTLLYDPIAGILSVRLIEAQDLQPRDFSGTADPYCKIRLLPNKTNVWQTRIHKRTLNPVFDEDFVFEERPAVIGRRTLEILLYDFDAYSRHMSIGSAQISLAHVDLSDKVELWRPLTSCTERDAKVELGDIMVSLSYLPSAERLTVVIIKARNLRVVDDSRNSSDPYVKVSILQGGKKLKKRKTGVQRANICPVFNEALIFDIAKDTLKSCLIEFIVMHDSLLGPNEPLGRAVIGNTTDVRVDERNFFEEMFRTKSATAQWIPLSEPSVSV